MARISPEPDWTACPYPLDVVPPGRFVGRERELATLQNWLDTPGVRQVIVDGPRRIGKTALLHELKRRLPPERFAVAYFDLHGVAPGVRASPVSNDRHVVLLLDGADPMDGGTAAARIKAFTEQLGAAGHAPRDMTTILGMSRTADTVRGPSASQFPNATLLQLKPFEEPEARDALIAPARGYYDYQARVWIGTTPEKRAAELCGGIPFAVNALGAAVFFRRQKLWNEHQETKARGEARSNDLDLAAPRAIELTMAGWRWLWQSLDHTHKLVCRALAEQGPRASVTLAFLQVKLDRLGIAARRLAALLADLESLALVQPGSSSTSPSLRSELFGRWVLQENPALDVADAEPRADAADALCREGQLYFENGLYEKALEHFQRALAVNERSRQARLGMAQAEAARRDYDSAITRFESLWYFNPDEVREPLARALEARIKDSRRDGAPFDNDLRRLEELKPTDPGVVELRRSVLLDRFLVALEVSPVDAVRTALHELRKHTQAGWQEAAIEAASRILAAAPDQDPDRTLGVLVCILPEFVHEDPVPARQSGIDQLFLLTSNLLQGAWKSEARGGVLERILRQDFKRILDVAPTPRRKGLLAAIRVFLDRTLKQDLEVRRLSEAARVAETYAAYAQEEAPHDLVTLAVGARQQLEHVCAKEARGAPIYVLELALRLGPPLIHGVNRDLPWEQSPYEWVLSLVEPALRATHVDHLAQSQPICVALENFLAKAPTVLGKRAEDALRLLPKRRQDDAPLHKAGDRILRRYVVEDRLDVRLAGQRSAKVEIYRCRDEVTKQPVNAKVFRMGVAERSGVLDVLWERERRALMALSGLDDASAIARFIEARQDANNGALVVVTEAYGKQTLRDLLDAPSQRTASGPADILRPEQRQRLWRELYRLIVAVQLLRSVRILHRNLSPDAVHIVSEGDAEEERPLFRLAHFEWSAYLRDLMSLSKNQRVETWTHYHAPEVLAQVLNLTEGGVEVRGESGAADLFSLGVLLFECLVDRLPEADRREFKARGDLDMGRHRRWVEGLRRTAREHPAVSREESDIIEALLQFDVSAREAVDLDTLAERAEQLGYHDGGLQGALDRGRSLLIATVIQRGEFDFTRKLLARLVADAMKMDNDQLRAFFNKELSRAAVYRNTERGSWPLLLKGQLCWFRAKPFEHDDELQHGIAYVELWHNADTRGRQPIAILSEVDVQDQFDVHVNLAVLRTRHGSWEDLFKPRQSVERLLPEHRQVGRFVQILNQLETQLWDEQIYPYKILNPTDDGEAPDRIVIVEDEARQKEREDTLLRKPQRLADFISRKLQENERHFELGTDPTPTQPFDWALRFRVERVESESGEVHLVREGAKFFKRPRNIGWLRPWVLEKSLPLYRRRAYLEEELPGDRYLLDAVVRPNKPRHRLELPKNLKLFNKKLDGAKVGAVRGFLSVIPLFLVQGPPGTGKTTMAREVVRQLLEQSPYLRILVTAQSHEPLNNLLWEIEKDHASQPAAERPLGVRLLNESRLDPKLFGEEAERLKAHTAVHKAAAILRASYEWMPNARSPLKPLRQRWIDGVEAELKLGPGDHVVRRIQQSANVVYTTCNDKRLEELDVGEFDVAIIEEAGKAYASELLVPMRLSRRWLLIGDHHQLDPYRIDDLGELFALKVERLRKQEAEARKTAPRELTAYHEEFDVKDDKALRKNFGERLKFFEWLFTNAEEGTTRTALSQQWRMHPDINHLVADLFYSSATLKPGDPKGMSERQNPFSEPAWLRKKALVWLDVPHGEEQHLREGGFVNPAEVNEIVKFVSSLRPTANRKEIAFLSPYKAQVRALRDELAKSFELGDACLTVDSSQGRQWRVVVVSLVRSQPPGRSRHPAAGVGFLMAPERLNVMFSRAEDLLVIVGNRKHFERYARDCRVFSAFQIIKRLGFEQGARS